jgi:hypothetical protein
MLVAIDKASGVSGRSFLSIAGLTWVLAASIQAIVSVTGIISVVITGTSPPWLHRFVEVWLMLASFALQTTACSGVAGVLGVLRIGRVARAMAYAVAIVVVSAVPGISSSQALFGISQLIAGFVAWRWSDSQYPRTAKRPLSHAFRWLGALAFLTPLLLAGFAIVMAMDAEPGKFFIEVGSVLSVYILPVGMLVTGTGLIVLIGGIIIASIVGMRSPRNSAF